MLHADIVLPNNLGFVRLGRQPFDWGLGILANGGHDPHSDLGFVVDRLLWLKSFPAGAGTFTLVLVSDVFTQGTSSVRQFKMVQVMTYLPRRVFTTSRWEM